MLCVWKSGSGVRQMNGTGVPSEVANVERGRRRGPEDMERRRRDQGQPIFFKPEPYDACLFKQWQIHFGLGVVLA